VRAEPSRNGDVIYSAFNFPLLRAPGRRLVLVLAASEAMGAEGRDQGIKSALIAWFQHFALNLRNGQRKGPPVSLLAIGKDGTVNSVLESEALYVPTAQANRLIEERITSIKFNGERQHDLEALDIAYRTLHQREMIGDLDPAGGFLFIADGPDGERSAFTRADGAILALIGLGDKTPLRVATLGSCERWQRFSALMPINSCQSLPATVNLTADGAAAVLKKAVDSMFDQAFADLDNKLTTNTER
jgi:hypothetical protein